MSIVHHRSGNGVRPTANVAMQGYALLTVGIKRTPLDAKVEEKSDNVSPKVEHKAEKLYICRKKEVMSDNCQTRRMYGHDYAVPGTYEVTMTVAGRRPVFGEIVGTTKGDGEKPHLKPSPLGQMVLNNELPKIHLYYPMVDIWQICLMPDHIHMIVRINQPLPKGKHLGIIIGAFKGGISRAWWQLEAAVSAASAVESRSPLFEPNYNEHILMRDGQLENWKRYLRDNPLRYMMRREYPDLFQRSLCIAIGGTRYCAFGNMLLLRQPEKHKVFFHRRTKGVPTENTDFWMTKSQQLMSAANSGDVLVTPDVSECEMVTRISAHSCPVARGHAEVRK